MAMRSPSTARTATARSRWPTAIPNSTWGAPTTATHNSIGDLGFRYLYVGQFGVQWDNAFGLGLHYMQARHYAPALGRFLQPDPDGSETNLYAYAANNPVTEIDPDGNCFIVCAIVNAVLDTAIYLATTDSKDWSLQGVATAAVTGAILGFVGVGLISKVAKVGSVMRAVSSGSNAVKATTRAVSASRYIGRGGMGYAPVRMVNPKAVRYSQDSIRCTFKDGRSVPALAQQLRSGSARNVPTVVVYRGRQGLVSLDNRRLWAHRTAGVPMPVRQATLSELRKILNDPKRLSAGRAGSESIRLRGGGW